MSVADGRRRAKSIGAPAIIDGSASACNAAEYLDNHLRSVISAIGQAGEIQLSAIGISYAVDRYYERSIAGSALPCDVPELYARSLRKRNMGP